MSVFRIRQSSLADGLNGSVLRDFAGLPSGSACWKDATLVPPASFATMQSNDFTLPFLFFTQE